jgi:tRNA G46 methylase TrmB
MPLDLEIGCGVGWHPIRYALTHPGRQLLAIERTRAKFTRFSQRYDSHLSGRAADTADKLRSLHPIHDDAVNVLAHAPPSWRFSRVFFLYPNPEPKSPKRRWPRSPVRQLLVEHLDPTSAHLVAASNDAALIADFLNWFHELADALGLCRAQSVWVSRINRNDRHFGLTAPRTHFEKKYLERGETCTQVEFAVKGRDRLD